MRTEAEVEIAPPGLFCMAHCCSTRDLRLLQRCRADRRWESGVGGDRTLEQSGRLCADASAWDTGLRSPDDNRIGQDGFRREFCRAQSPGRHVHGLCSSWRRVSLDSCEWPAPGSTSSVKLADNEDRTGIQIILRSGSLVVIRVKDPLNATSRGFFLPGVIVGTGGYFRANYDTTRQAYTCLILKGIPAHLFFDTLLIVQDGDGNSVPVDPAVLPFTTSADEVPLFVSVMPALVNAASYFPGVTSGRLRPCLDRGLRTLKVFRSLPVSLCRRNFPALRSK